MAVYARTRIEHPEDPSVKYERGDELPEDLPGGLDHLLEHGAASHDQPVNDPTDPLYSRYLHGPAVRVIEVQDGGTAAEAI